eukprot:Opistho-1_new@97581
MVGHQRTGVCIETSYGKYITRSEEDYASGSVDPCALGHGRLPPGLDGDRLGRRPARNCLGNVDARELVDDSGKRLHNLEDLASDFGSADGAVAARDHHNAARLREGRGDLGGDARECAEEHVDHGRVAVLLPRVRLLRHLLRLRLCLRLNRKCLCLATRANGLRLRLCLKNDLVLVGLRERLQAVLLGERGAANLRLQLLLLARNLLDLNLDLLLALNDLHLDLLLPDPLLCLGGLQLVRKLLVRALRVHLRVVRRLLQLEVPLALRNGRVVEQLGGHARLLGPRLENAGIPLRLRLANRGVPFDLGRAAHTERVEIALVVAHVLDCVRDDRDAHVTEVGRGDLEDGLGKLLAVLPMYSALI